MAAAVYPFGSRLVGICTVDGGRGGYCADPGHHVSCVSVDDVVLLPTGCLGRETIRNSRWLRLIPGRHWNPNCCGEWDDSPGEDAVDYQGSIYTEILWPEPEERPRGLIDAYSIHMSWYIVRAYSNMHAPGIYPYIPRFCLHVHSLLYEVLLSSTPAAGDAQPSAAKRDTDYFLGVSGIE